MKKPPLIPSLITLAFVLLMTNLGFWQLNRAQEKEQLLKLLTNDHITEIKEKSQLQDLPQYANAKLTGHYLQQPQLLLDNQIDNQMVGYHVFTPFVLDYLDTIVLVNRGWISKQGFKAEQLQVDSSKQTILGKLNHPPQVGIQLGEIQLDKNKPYQIMTYFEKSKVSQFLHESLCKQLNCVVNSNILWLQANQANGFKRNWQPIIMLPSKHIAYAVQWFGMTIVLIVIFFYWLRKGGNKNSDD
jgi:surfeit locus 1 family protein